MNFEFLRRIAAEAVDAELSQIAETGGAEEGLVSRADITVDAQPAKSPITEEDEYEWIVRSTPSAVLELIGFDEWSEPNLTPPVELSNNQAEEPEAEEYAPMWHGRLARGLESSPVADQEDFAAEWSAPDLSPQVELSNIDEAEQNASLPVSGEVEFAAEWSAPDLTPPVNFSDIEESEAEDNASLSASAEEAVQDDLSEVTLSPQVVSFSDVEQRDAEDNASLSGVEQEEFAGEVSDLTLMSGPTDFSESESEEEESAAPSRTEDTLAHIGPSPQPPGSLSIQYPVVHLLKDPPEIWDQVPEQPAEFHPAVTFLARVAANNQKLMLMTLGVMLLCGVCTFAILKLWQADRGNAVAVQAQPEHRIEVPQPTVAATAPTETGPTAQKSAASPVDSSDKSSAASVDSSSRDAENKNIGKPADSDETAKTSTESMKNTANAAKNSGKGKALATTAHAANKAKGEPTSVARSASRNTRSSAPAVARNTTTSRNSPQSPRNTTTASKNSPATSRRTTTASTSSPSTARKPAPAPVISYGDGETRPRLVTQRISATKDDQPKRADESRRSPGHPSP